MSKYGTTRGVCVVSLHALRETVAQPSRLWWCGIDRRDACPTGRIMSCAVIISLLLVGISSANPVPDYDFNWATVGDLGNPAYEGGPYGQLAGRGSVDYEYRISRLEVTTAQWMEFVNTFSVQFPGGDPWGLEPTYISGMTIDYSYGGPGIKFKLNDFFERPAEMPVIGISWRDAAMYCNWLHNGKSTDPASLEYGAYDTSTWGYDQANNQYSDAPTHEPGAQFWIPTLDEWLKAVHYDPNKNGVGDGGWWMYGNGSDDPFVPGRPGEGTSTAGWEPAGFPWWEPYTIPLGAFEDVMSPWGLWDKASGTE